MALLRNPEKAEVFANRVADLMTKQIGSEEQNVDMMTSPTYVNDVFVEVVQKVSLEQLPPVPKRSVKPWLTFQAFALIDQRVYARQQRDYDEEKVLTGLLKRQIKEDKTVKFD